MQSLVQVPGVNDGKTAQEFFGLGEGAVGHGQRAAAIAHGNGSVNRLQPRRKNVVATLLQLRLPGCGGIAVGKNLGEISL